MENQPGKKENEKEEKVGVIPVLELEGTDADKAYDDETDTKEEGQQRKGSDSDSR